MNIGKLAVTLTADAGGLLKGVGNAGKAVKNFTSDVSSAISRMTQLTGLGNAASLGGLHNAFRQGVADITRMDMASRRLGLGINEFRALLVSAGPAADAVSSAVGTLAGKVAAVKLGSVDAARSFQAMGGVGGKSTVEVWGKALKFLSEMPNQARRAVAAFDLLGPAAADLLPELMRGPAGLADAQSTARRLGLAVDDNDLNKVREMQRIFGQIDMFKQGFANQLAMGISPIVVELNKALGLMEKLDISGLKTGIVNFAEGASKLGVAVYESFRNPAVQGELFGFFNRLMKYAGEKFSEYLLYGVGRLFQSIGSINLGRLLGSIDLGSTGNRLLLQSQHHGGQAGFHIDMAGVRWRQLMDEIAGTPGMRALGAFFANVRGQQPQQSWTQQLAGLAQQARGGLSPLSLLSAAGGRGGIAGLLGGVGAQFGGAAARAVGGMAGAVTPQFAQMLNAQFAGMAGAAKTPVEAFKEAIAQVRQFESMGKFAGAGGADLKARMVSGAFGGLVSSSSQLLEPRFAGAATAGSREAYSSIVAHQRGPGNDPAAVLRNILKVQEQMLQQQVRNGQVLEEAVRNMPQLAVQGAP